MLLHLVCARAALAGQDAEIFLHSFDYQCSGRAIILEASLELTASPALQAALTNGAVIDLEITADLLRTRFLLPDVKVTRAQFKRQIRYDALARDFVLLSPEGDSARFRALPTLFSSLLSMLTLNLPLDAPLASSDKYRLTLGLSMRQANLPDWLERGLIFWPWEDSPPTIFSFDLTPDCVSMD